MKIKLKELGSIKQAEFELGDFTIICGNNNTGKTYATYALFGFLHVWQELLTVVIKDTDIETLLNNGVVKIDLSAYLENYMLILEKACEKYTQSLPTIFAAPETHFNTTNFQIILAKPSLIDEYEAKFQSENTEIFSLFKSENTTELVVSLLAGMEKNIFPEKIIKRIISNAIIEILFKKSLPKPFISSAERTGATIFSNELNFSRNRLLKEMHNLDKDIDSRELLFKNYQDYALPVEKNVDFIRNLKKDSKKYSFISEKHSEILDDFTDIIGGKYHITENDELYFNPKRSKVKLTMDESSSAVRSLLDMGFYLRHVAEKGDLLMVDEPELNLHPENQRRVARLFSRLVKIGIKVFITTHSDYFVKELNTLIMLNHDKAYLKRIAEDEGYKDSDLISAERVKVYIAEKASIKLDGKKRKYPYQTLTPAKIDSELGIEARSFDTTINTMNRIQEAIVWGDDD
ncbi:AAA family ATPase [Candidatus Venteria ishoeyi]|uniref:AAA family ATPase n=1 Tax=Candidatus Venteria ishoeyi TaxID=1899563 RepID=UPI0025A61966|nr:AAA family ATPase [Candidatus Venteria ishoeyi]MDM8547166.1 AAA family ATPase [Candidatus Venteria ishoeyi]